MKKRNKSVKKTQSVQEGRFVRREVTSNYHVITIIGSITGGSGRTFNGNVGTVITNGKLSTSTANNSTISALLGITKII